MNILYVVPRIPYPLNNGGQIRTHHFLLNIARHHSVTLICPVDQIDATEQTGIDLFKRQGINVRTVSIPWSQKDKYKRVIQIASLFSYKPYAYFRYYSNAMQIEIDEHLESNVYNVVIVDHSQMGFYRYNTIVPIYLDMHNVEYLLMQRIYLSEKNYIRKIFAYIELMKFRKYELEICKKFDMCFTTSSNDADALHLLAPDVSCTVLSNGVDCEHFYPKRLNNDSNIILFVGTINYHPNVDGLQYFIRDIWPLVKRNNTNATFLIVGKNPPSSILQLSTNDPTIKITGTVDDVRHYYESASVVVVPLRIGGGTRIKILEAMAMQKAIVSTSLGAEGIDVTDGKNIIIRDRPKAFSEAILKALSDQELQLHLGAEGRALVTLKYDWKSISTIMAESIETIR